MLELTLYMDGSYFFNGQEGAVAAAAVHHQDGSNQNHGEVLLIRHRQPATRRRMGHDAVREIGRMKKD